MGEAAALDGRWIPILWVSVLFHDVLGVNNVVHAEGCEWKSLSGSLSVSSMVQDGGIWRLGSLGGEIGCCGWSWGCVFFGVLLGVVKLGVSVRLFDGVGVVGWGREGLFGDGCVGVVIGVVRVSW